MGDAFQSQANSGSDNQKLNRNCNRTGSLVGRLVNLEGLLVLAYAFSLPLSLTASWVLFLLGVAMTALIWVVDRKPTLPVRLPPLTYPFLAFALAVFASGFANGFWTEAFRCLWSLKSLTVYFWANYCFQRNQRLPLTCLQLLLSLSGLAGLWGTIQQLFNFHPFGFHYLQGTGFLSGPMAFAGQMQIFALLAAGLWITGGYQGFKEPINGRAWFSFVTLSNLLGLIFAAERSAWLGAILGLVSMSARISWRFMLKAVLTIAIAVVIAWSMVPVVKNRTLELQHWQSDVSVTVRLLLWRRSLSLFAGSPLLGIGIDRYPHFNLPQAIVPGRSKDINHAHSNYLQILTTTGILGLATYLWLFVTALRQANSLCRSPERFTSGLGLGILGGVVSTMVSGLFEYNFGTSQVRLAQWFILAMIPHKIHSPAEGHPEVKSP